MKDKTGHSYSSVIWYYSTFFSQTLLNWIGIWKLPIRFWSLTSCFSLERSCFTEGFISCTGYSFGSFICIGCFSVQSQLLTRRSRAATLALSSSFSDISLLSMFSSLFAKSSRVYPVIPFGRKRHSQQSHNANDLLGVQYNILCVSYVDWEMIFGNFSLRDKNYLCRDVDLYNDFSPL